ncbi:acylneuraminate cytidylyltransferase family protein [Dictyobacter arantiisoli]|uniref:acylneuraminate cytidylyltransferase family protein n=1 Tax=Dictyobacter arantiisoli TaxID=2014874 RepID=UPI00155A32B5|nr:acylneuraminate cytidylyltransferase family protein [Dictyobacter arantiisoli]
MLAGKPLLYYIVQAAYASSYLNCENVFISTEDEEIARYAESLNARILHRPPALADDSGPSFRGIQWGVNELHRQGIEPDICVTMRPTSPLCSGEDVDAAIELLLSNSEADSVISVGPAIAIHPARLKRILNNGRLEDAYESEGQYPQRRQSFEQLYLRNGAVYVTKAAVIHAGSLWGSKSLAYVMPEERSININTEFQFTMAELLIRNKEAAS